MSRRSDPARIYLAQRAGMLMRVSREWRMGEAEAEVLVAAWEAEAARRGLRPGDARFWPDAEAWLALRRR